MNPKRILPTLVGQALSAAYQDAASVELVSASFRPKLSSARSVIFVRADPEVGITGEYMTARLYTITCQLDRPLILSAELLCDPATSDVRSEFMGGMSRVGLKVRSRTFNPRLINRNGVVTVSQWWAVTASLKG